MDGVVPARGGSKDARAHRADTPDASASALQLSQPAPGIMHVPMVPPSVVAMQTANEMHAWGDVRSQGAPSGAPCTHAPREHVPAMQSCVCVPTWPHA